MNRASPPKRPASTKRGIRGRTEKIGDEESGRRDTGIRLLGNMPWGTHICVFYESPADLIDTAIPYFKAGLDSNEFCIWAVSASITMKETKEHLRDAIPDFDERYAARQFELIPARDWYLKGDEFDLKRITGGWSQKLKAALSRGYDGMRVSGNAFWIRSNYWQEFCEYEQELDRSLARQKMIVLCTYPLNAARAVDILDVARAHQCTIARRNGDWEFLETPELAQARLEISRLNGALDILLKPFPGHEQLTPRERAALAQIVRGASSKEAARMLGISPRTMEFHRSNIMRKFSTKNVVDLVRKVLSHNRGAKT